MLFCGDILRVFAAQKLQIVYRALSRVVSETRMINQIEHNPRVLTGVLKCRRSHPDHVDIG